MVNAMPGVRIISEPMIAWLAEVPSRLQPRMHASVMSAAQLILQKPPGRSCRPHSSRYPLARKPASAAANALRSVPPKISAKQNAPHMPETSCTQSLGKGMRRASTRRLSASSRVILPSAISRERAFTAATRLRWVVRLGTLRTSLISAVPALAKMPLVST